MYCMKINVAQCVQFYGTKHKMSMIKFNKSIILAAHWDSPHVNTTEEGIEKNPAV